MELEHDDGLTIDSVLLVGHLAGRETGIEEIHFEDGVICDRTRMDAPTRTGRFNAQDDAVRFADKDAPFAIDAALLFENGSDVPDEPLSIVAVGTFVNSSVTIDAGGNLIFLSAPDFFGDAVFEYSVADRFGRQSTAAVEVTVRDVNDAPAAQDDGVFQGLDDVALFIPYAKFLANDGDVDGDALVISAFDPLKDAEGNPVFFDLFMAGSNGGAVTVAGGVIFTPPAQSFRVRRVRIHCFGRQWRLCNRRG